MHPTLLAHLVLSPGSSCRARRAAKARSEAEAVVVTSSPDSMWLWGAGKKSKYRSTILRVEEEGRMREVRQWSAS